MGAPSQALIESYTDQIAAMLQAGIAGARAACGLAALPVNGGGKAVDAMFNLIDASGDPDVQNGLGPTADALDKRAFGLNLYNIVANACRDSDMRAAITAISNEVKSVGGGSNTNLATYLDAAGATVDPLFRELAGAVLGQTIWTIGGDITTVNAPEYATVAPTRVYTGADGSLAEDTTDAQDVGTADVALLAADNDCIYLGLDRKYSAVVFGLSTLATSDVAWTPQYWNGNAWTTISGLTDSSVGLTKNRSIKFTEPSDWQRCNADFTDVPFADLTPLFYTRWQRTENTVATPPVATIIRLQPVVSFASDGVGHLGMPQPALAICDITNTNAMATVAGPAVDYAKFIEPSIIFRALTPIGNDLTITFQYYDQTGATGSQAQSAWTAPAALGTRSSTLAGGDTGVRNVRTTSTVVTAATEGVFEVASVVPRTLAL